MSKKSKLLRPKFVKPDFLEYDTMDGTYYKVIERSGDPILYIKVIKNRKQDGFVGVHYDGISIIKDGKGNVFMQEGVGLYTSTLGVEITKEEFIDGWNESMVNGVMYHKSRQLNY